MIVNSNGNIKKRYEGYSSLMFYNARFYDPAIAHFVQADTINPDPGSAIGYNRYAYTAYNPLKYVDPSGHEPILPPPPQLPLLQLRLIEYILRISSAEFNQTPATQQALSLVQDWYTETGDEYQEFYWFEQVPSFYKEFE